MIAVKCVFRRLEQLFPSVISAGNRWPTLALVSYVNCLRFSDNENIFSAHFFHSLSLIGSNVNHVYFVIVVAAFECQIVMDFPD